MTVARAIAALIDDSTVITYVTYSDGSFDATDVEYPCLVVEVLDAESEAIGMGTPSYFASDSTGNYPFPVYVHREKSKVRISAHVESDDTGASGPESVRILERVRDYFEEDVLRGPHVFSFVDPDLAYDYGVYRLKMEPPWSPVYHKDETPRTHSSTLMMQVWHRRQETPDAVPTIQSVKMDYGEDDET